MSWLGEIGRRMRFYLQRDRYEAEMNEEVEFHLSRRADELEAGGEPEREARLQAIKSFGNRAQLAETSRSTWSFGSLERIAAEVRFASRGFRRTPLFAVIAMLTLGLGVGANTAIFSIVDSALLKPLPYPEPDRLVTLDILPGTASVERTSRFAWSYPKFETFRARATSFDAMAGIGSSNLNLRSQAGVERIEVEEVSAPYFGMLGVTPVAGRVFAPDEDSLPQARPVVMLSERLWRSRFGSDPRTVGSSISLSDVPLTIVGVVPAGFRGLSGIVDAWVPMMMTPAFEGAAILKESGNHWFNVIGKLKRGVALAQAQAEANTVGRAVDQQFRDPAQPEAWSAVAAPLAESRTDPVLRRASVLLLGTVGLVLLIACVNIASLLLVRATARTQELSVRLALGASRRDLARQLLVESLLLSVGGCIVGVGLAYLTHGVLVRLVPAQTAGPAGMPYLLDPRSAAFGCRVLGFAAVLALVTGALTGILPMWQAMRGGLGGQLRDLSGGRSAAAVRRRGWGVHRMLVTLELALAVIVLVGAGLLIRSLVRLETVDRGFESSGVATFSVSASDQDYAGSHPVEFKSRVLERLASMPGIEAVGVNLCAPLTAGCSGSVVTQAGETRFKPQDAKDPIGLHYVSPGYFKVLGIPLRAGRLFDATDRPGSPRVVLINQAAALRLWPGRAPLGQLIAIASGYFYGGDSTATVVGVVGDVRYGAPEQPAGPDAYLPALQRSFSRTMFLVKTSTDPLGRMDGVRAVIHAIDPGVPIYSVRTMQEIAATATARTRFATVMLSGFGALALLLAAIGVYGVMAYLVSARTREIGIRLAIGAEPGQVRRMVLGEGAVVAVVGIGLGIGGAVAAGRLLRSLLFEVGPTDLGTYAAATVTLLVATLLANAIPAWRAARLPPMDVLRVE
ncbi:MAG: ABC transporter permease [Gemmatimonadota bacterium]